MQDALEQASFASLEADRQHNLRQLVLAVGRKVGGDVHEELRARGHHQICSSHTTVLANMALSGSSISETAERAGMTKQVLGRLARELDAAGYVNIEASANDARVRVLTFTEKGRQLMRESFDIMADLQNRYAGKIGKDRFDAFVKGAEALLAAR